MNIRTEASCVIDVPPDELFEPFVGMDITRLMTGYGPFPEVSRLETLEGEWGSVGARRKLHLADGTSAIEELKSIDSPRRYTYLVTENRGPLGLMVRAIHGDFQFTEEDGGTHVDWSHTFDVKLPFVGLLWPILKLGWAKYLDAALKRAKTIMETTEKS